MRASDVACVILASGLSERFGDADKLEISLCGIPVLEYVLKTASLVGFGEIFLVSKFGGTKELTTVVNHHPKLGQGHSLRLGLKTAHDASWKNICVMLGDMPLIEVAHLQKLMGKLTKGQSVISQFGDKRMPPAIFDKSAVSKILKTDFKTGARAMFDELNLMGVPISAVQTLDIDTLEDLNRVEAIMKARAT